MAPASVADAFSRRLQRVPAATSQNRHRTRCVLPRALATLLRRRPQLISRAVRVFTLRSKSETTAASTFKRFGPPPKARAGHPPPRPEDAKGEEEDAASAPGKRAVEVTVAMTRCLYAQLEQQHFAAPTRLAMAWKANLGRCDDGPSLHRGAKITAAFEMIFARAEKTPSSSVAMPPRAH